MIGIDGCKAGWLVVKLIKDEVEISLSENISDLVPDIEKAHAILIDMPIGLPENRDEAEKRPEQKVRKLLPKKTSTVFNVPCRQAVYESTYERANEQNKQILGKGLSKQSFYIAHKCKELDLFLNTYPPFKNKIVESHPELLFARLTEDKRPILSSKRNFTGVVERINLLTNILKKHFNMKLDIMNEPLFKKYPDDVVDALCLAIVGKLGLQHGYKTIPNNPSTDSKGLLMKMTYYESES